MPGAKVAVVVVTLALATAAPAGAAGTLTVQMLDVGAGDATVFEGPCGELGVLDVPSKARRTVLDALDGRGSRVLRWLAVSHYDADHVGGVAWLLHAHGIKVPQIFDRGGEDAPTGKTYRGYAAAADGRREAKRIRGSFQLCSGADAVRFRVMSVAHNGQVAGGLPVTGENDRGLCLKITYLRFGMAACGDVNGTKVGTQRADVESAVARSFGRVDLVEVNHHGSRYSSNPTFINTLRPSVAVISAGGRHGHPNPETVARWKLAGSQVYMTRNKAGERADGTVTVTTQGTGFFRLRTDGSGELATFRLSGGSRPPSPPPPDNTDPLEELIPGGGMAAIVVGAAAGMLRSRRKQSPLAAVFALIDAMRSRAEDAEERVRKAWPAASQELERLERRSGTAGETAGDLRKRLDAAVTRGDPTRSEVTRIEELAWDLEDLLV